MHPIRFVCQITCNRDRAGSGCLNSLALEISGFLPGFLVWCFGGATQGGRSLTGVARPKRGEVHAAALCGR